MHRLHNRDSYWCALHEWLLRTYESKLCFCDAMDKKKHRKQHRFSCNYADGCLLLALVFCFHDLAQIAALAHFLKGTLGGTHGLFHPRNAVWRFAFAMNVAVVSGLMKMQSAFAFRAFNDF